MSPARWPVEVVGLIPAAGEARRIAPLPVSKELFPLGFRPGPDGMLRPQVVSSHLLGHFAAAGIERALFLIRDGKWDIPHYFGTGRGHGPNLDLGYLVVDPPLGVGYSLDRANAHVRGAVCAAGFPDILFGPPDTYATLLSALFASEADVVVNLVPMPDPSKATMVDHVGGRVRGFVERPAESVLTDSYCAVVWRPAFGAYLHDLIAGVERSRSAGAGHDELPLGAILDGALRAGLRVDAVRCGEPEPFLDIGTPDDLVLATRRAVQDPGS